MRLHRPRTLTLRIMLAEVAAILVVAILLPLLLVSVLHGTAAASENVALLGQAQAIAAGLRVEHGRVIADRATVLRYGDTYDGRAFVVTDPGGAVRAASSHAGAVPWTRVPRTTAPDFVRIAPFRLASVPVIAAGLPLRILVSQDETRPGVILDDVMRAFLARYLLILLPVLLLLPLVNALLIRRIVLAVRRTSARAAEIGPMTLAIRLEDEGLPAEIMPLVAATNRLVARLEQGFNQQAEFVANVVHELRTPLSTLMVSLEGVGDPAARAPLERQVERLSHVVSQLRDLAALEDAATLATERIDLAALAAETVAEMAPSVFAADHRIALAGGDREVAIVANVVLVRLALSNLIANAVRHTPAGTAIRVVVQGGCDARIAVEDDGPGIVAGGEPTRRFWRADHSRTDSAGLGLAIVGRVMAVHRGRLEIGSGPHGGTHARLVFPPADA
ncbi:MULTISPECIES: ATP-binding protein [unclassified Sphingomonas]|uniref:sensor histidine kinase n=1 Tax=unclassified Sphingomonas TaxID=196159 RepID=UPI002269B932|nr:MULTISPECIES: ATP-binding protein [unclassified Sphingomonas]